MEDRVTRIGRYEVLEALGRGAMGIVYKARDPNIQRLVAIKTISQLKTDPESTQEFRTRLAIEARAAGSLSHPHIVTIYDVGEMEDELRTPYVVMEYLAGPSLHKKLATTGGRMPWTEALPLVCDLARALQFAHKQGIVHRDVKPSNILFTEDGIAKIADFGIAHVNLSETTLPGHVLGTPAYMSPEQLNGQEVDGRSDLFSLGVMLYAMLTGHRPFQGNSAMTVSFKVMHGDPVPVSALECTLPADIDYVISRLLAKDPDDRYTDGEELALDLDDLQAQQPPRSRSSIFLAPHPTTTSSTPRVDRSSVSLRSSGSSQILRSRKLAVPWWKRPRLVGSLAIALLLTALLAEIMSRARSSAVGPSGAGPVADAAQLSVNSSAPAVSSASMPASAQPAILRSSAAPAPPAPRHTTSASKEVLSTLTVDVHHRFSEGKLSVWVDERLALSTDLRGESRKRLLVFNGVKGYESVVVPVPVGTHRLRVRVVSGTYDQSALLAATFSTHREQALHVTCTLSPPKIHAAFN